ncbi:hypothetical protein POM88_020780 [Heracleum sosnowskyi]|uniref:TF-B3 domain-containing protein n=1 Tax=Heracleum sosnowskyi TaxID=360622 RepID=A0AAD8ICH3_9APIA|nr:hypothetical protein POM88_020780 [Heracleum sosnowskyi]
MFIRLPNFGLNIDSASETIELTGQCNTFIVAVSFFSPCKDLKLLRIGKMSRDVEKKDTSFICLNVASVYVCGSLTLPPSFSAKYGDVFLERIYLKLPSSGGFMLEIEMFNTYGVEKKYIERDSLCEKPIFTRRGGGWVKDVNYLDCDFEIDKLEAQFCYNVIKNGTGIYDLVISKNHLKRGLHHEVLSSNACRQMSLNETMAWVEIGYNFLMWKIKLKWKDGKLTFYKGVQQGKSLMKWVKILNDDTTVNGEMEIPRVFVDEFGETLTANVHLVVGDGTEYCVRYCAFNNFLYRMKNMFLKYKVLSWSHWPVVVLSDDRCEGDEEIENSNSMMVVSHAMMGESLSTESSADMNNDVVHEDDAERSTMFSVVLKSSHMDQKGLGVYISRKLEEIYKRWTNGSVITLVHGELSFKVKVHRHKSRCRFGRGWDTFTSKLEVVQGQMLEFAYRGNSTFEVYIVT